MAEGGEDEDLVVDGGVVGGGEVFAEDAFDGYFFVGGAVGAAAYCGKGAGFELCWGWGDRNDGRVSRILLCKAVVRKLDQQSFKHASFSTRIKSSNRTCWTM